MITVLLVCVLMLLIFSSWFFMLWDSWTMKNIKGPLPLPIIGNGHLFLGNSRRLLDTLSNLVKTYGDVSRVYILSQRFIVLAHPKYIEGMLSSTELINKGVSYNYLHSWLGQGLLTSNGQRWKTHRKFLTPAFHYGILKKFLPIFIKNNYILVKKLKTVADGRSINLFQFIALTALDNITEAIMGVSVNAQNNSESEYVKANEEISMIISKRMRNLFLNKDITFNLSSYKTKQDKILKVLHGQSNEVIQARCEELEKSNINNLLNAGTGIKNKNLFLDLLLLAEVDGHKISNEHIREEVDTFMFEGHDTTSSGIVFCLYSIANNKEVQGKIVNEMRSIFEKDFLRDPTYIDLQEMKYLELVIKESLRLYPSVPLIQRTVAQDTKLADIVLKKDSAVIINILNMQRRPEIFPDPLKFKPERFEHNLNNPFDWLAFSAGPRNCIGQKFAMMEMKTVISSVVRNFELLPSGIEPILIGDLILRSENGVHIKLTPRL